MIMAPLLVWIGCQRALIEHSKSPEESQVEVVTQKDALKFPLLGSCVLFGLYIVVKLIDKAYIDALISAYFALLGAGGLFQCVQAPLTELLGLGALSRRQVSIDWQKWKRREAREPIEFSYSWFDGVLLACTSGLALWYSWSKLWWLNNLLGSAFAVQAPPSPATASP